MVTACDVLLINKTQLQKVLANSPEDKFSIVLDIPLFPNWMGVMMKMFEELNLGDIPTSNEEMSSSLIGERHSEEVMNKIREIEEHAKRNQSTLLTNPLVAVTPGEKSKKFRCYYSIYKGGKLWKGNLNRLSSPPTNLCVMQNISNLSLYVDWTFENPGYPHNAMILYRTESNGCDDGVPWKHQKVTDLSKTTIYFEPGSAIEIAIAMDTCIGRSEFFAFKTERLPFSVTETSRKIQNRPKRRSVVEGATAGPQQPLTTAKKMSPFVLPTCLEVENVTDCTVEILLSPSTRGNWRANYWRHGKESSAQSLNAAGSSIGCRLEKLQAGTTYSVNIVAVSDDGHGTSLPSSLPSQTVQFTTPKTKMVRFAEKMVKHCEKVGSENGLNLYAIPLTKSIDGMAEIFSFGEVDQSKQHKTIMLIGVADTVVKSRLINGMVNYIFNIDWLDHFRFQLISKESDEATIVPIKIYHIHHMEGLRIPYSLTIIDTPNQIGMENLNEKTRFIPFHANDVVNNMDLIISVADAPVSHPPSRQFYMFDSIVAIYRDVEIVSASNASDEKHLPLKCFLMAETALRHKFDSSVFFCWNQKTEEMLKTDGNDASRRPHFQSYYREYKLNRFMWSMGINHFECIFLFKFCRIKTQLAIFY